MNRLEKNRKNIDKGLVGISRGKYFFPVHYADVKITSNSILLISRYFI
tara:strand:+ start:337 stop:480 length:144 start_codon:yes stop_codon:yes gene_type:complete